MCLVRQHCNRPSASLQPIRNYPLRGREEGRSDSTVSGTANPIEEGGGKSNTAKVEAIHGEELQAAEKKV